MIQILIPDVVSEVGFAFTLVATDGTRHQVVNHTTGVGRDVAQALAQDVNQLAGTDPAKFDAVAEGQEVVIARLPVSLNLESTVDVAQPGFSISEI